MTNKTSTISQLGLFSTLSLEALESKKEFAWTKKPFFALDIETNGLNPIADRIIEIALVPFNISSKKEINQLLNIPTALSAEIEKITGINDNMLKDQPNFLKIADKIIEHMENAEFIIAYNANFDKSFLESEFARINKVLPNIPWIDPFVFICDIDRYKKGKKLVDAANRWGIKLQDAHRAYNDALAAGELMLKLSDTIAIDSLKDLYSKQNILYWQNAHHRHEMQKKQEWSINR